MSVDSKTPTAKSISRILLQLKSEEYPSELELEFERRVNKSLPDIPRDEADDYSSRLREEMRRSPCPQSPISSAMKRKFSHCDFPQDKNGDFYRPIKRLIRRDGVYPTYTHHRSNSGSSIVTDVSMTGTPTAGAGSPLSESPRLVPGALPLNLTFAGSEFSKMRLN
ncbi:hypothetical protein HDV01_000603 [Terramyces sp. JEL0728]|nr:hypothetical protein HDV01_000603 [Terramyces sp. JEL0728]